MSKNQNHVRKFHQEILKNIDQVLALNERFNEEIKLLKNFLLQSNEEFLYELQRDLPRVDRLTFEEFWGGEYFIDYSWDSWNDMTQNFANLFKIDTISAPTKFRKCLYYIFHKVRSDDTILDTVGVFNPYLLKLLIDIVKERKIREIIVEGFLWLIKPDGWGESPEFLELRICLPFFNEILISNESSTKLRSLTENLLQRINKIAI